MFLELFLFYPINFSCKHLLTLRKYVFILDISHAAGHGSRAI
jgi:hypothetical protein